MLQHNLKRAVQLRHDRNIDELKHFYREEWFEMTPHLQAAI